jgi:voltage-gated potassium channel
MRTHPAINWMALLSCPASVAAVASSRIPPPCYRPDMMATPPTTFRDQVNQFFRDYWLPWELGMGVLAILYVVLPFLAEEAGTGGTDWTLIESVLTAFFLIEFFARLLASYDRLSHLRSHWIDAVALIPVVRGIRIARLLRMGRLVRTFVGVQRASTTVDRLAPYQTTFNLVIAWITTMVVSALTFYVAEREVNPAVTTLTDALWWSINTITVGSTEIVAVTDEGRAATAVLLVLGVALFAAITASLITLVTGDRENQHVRSRLRQLVVLRDAGDLDAAAYDEAVIRLSLEHPGATLEEDD